MIHLPTPTTRPNDRTHENPLTHIACAAQSRDAAGTFLKDVVRSIEPSANAPQGTHAHIGATGQWTYPGGRPPITCRPSKALIKIGFRYLAPLIDWFVNSPIIQRCIGRPPTPITLPQGSLEVPIRSAEFIHMHADPSRAMCKGTFTSRIFDAATTQSEATRLLQPTIFPMAV